MDIDPSSLFERYNRVGAHVDKIEAGVPASFGTCDQVRVLFPAKSPREFVIAWWSPWPEGDPRAMHVVEVRGYVKVGDALTLEDVDGAIWRFTMAVGEFAQSVADYHRQVACDPEHYAALEAGALDAARSLFE